MRGGRGDHLTAPWVDAPPAAVREAFLPTRAPLPRRSPARRRGTREAGGGLEEDPQSEAAIELSVDENWSDALGFD